MKNKILDVIILFSILTMPYCIFAQNEIVCEVDTLKAQNLFDEAWKIKMNKPDSSIILSQSALCLSKTNKRLQWQGFRNISVAYSIKGILDSAEKYCNFSLEIAKELNSQKFLAGSYQNLGIVASQMGNNNLALSYYQKIIEIAEKTGDSLLVAKNLNNMGLSYEKIGDYFRSITCLMRGIKIAEFKVP